MTEQGNPGIYVQIDEWLPLYKGNIYVVDEVTGRMYLSKGEHLMRIAETASHRPFRDHELSISRHVPEKEYLNQEEQMPPENQGAGLEQGRGESIDPLTPIAGMAGEVGRTPVMVAESTCQSGEKPFTPSEVYGGGEVLTKGVYLQYLRKGRGSLIKDLKVFRRRGSLAGHCLDQLNHVHL